MKLFRMPDFFRLLYPKRVWKMESRDSVYLTFDDGPTEELTHWVLDELDKQNIKGTFFCVGENVKKYPEIFNEIIKRGHTVGNHTMNHEKGSDVLKTAYLESIEECVGLISSRLFRPPYGRLPRKWDKIISESYKIIMWSWLSHDFDESVDISRIFKKAESQIKAGDIIVLHDNNKTSHRLKEILPRLIEIIQKKGLKFDVLR